ncbi:uncharacterized protein FIESC28_01016 [Fusarium coffeatum]|uniref:SET domain-containing protein n=1 Tax=Fusarium coffeatum TaxID=231269 RepID=A0A366SA78_9HYPO|nr:uncharacterized protein FIESC28_01016 [Fusarium coffeatum]RBR26233.1 hypothetical protein FIESC28_01016 [Fusarium coffeatum]
MPESVCLCRIQDIPGKGLGLVAAARIPKGTRVLSEAPLLELSRNVRSMEHLRLDLADKLAALSEEQRQAYLSLQNSYTEDGPELGIARTNALPLGSNATRVGVFLDASRINHSCKQNAQNTWNESLQQLTIHAIQEIEVGSEITIIYLSERGDYESRHHALQDKFRFNCICELCSLPVAERKVSDRRLIEIQALDHSIGNGSAVLHAPLKMLQRVQRLLHLLTCEGIGDATVPRAYYDAFQIAITHGDQARAKVFAERALSARVLVEGYDSPEVEKLQKLSNDPSQHASHSLTTRLVSTIDEIPADMKDDDFEAWLWSEKNCKDQQFIHFRDEAAFPAFEDLPGEDDVDLDFFQTEDGFSYRPGRHWAFLGEITNAEFLFRLRLLVKDRRDQQIPVAFYTSQAGREVTPEMLKPGYTVVVFYAESHAFMDFSQGIRQEDQETLKVMTTSNSSFGYANYLGL